MAEKDVLPDSINTDLEPTRRFDWHYIDLWNAKFPNLSFVVPGLLPVGLALLAGRPKQGKGWLSLQLATAVASGTEFMNYPTSKGAVLYICLEDSPRRLQGRIKMQRLTPEMIPLRIMTSFPPLNPGKDGHYKLQKIIEGEIYKLIIIDTMARAFASAAIDWNQLGIVTSLLSCWQRLALDHEISILFVDHLRKPNQGVISEVDVVDDLMGSTGKTAVLDTIWGLYRKRGEPGAILKMTGREVADAELAVIFDKERGLWQCQGDAREVIRRSQETQIMETLRAGPPDGMSTIDVATAVNRDRANVQKQLERMAAAFFIIKDTLYPKGGGMGVLWRLNGTLYDRDGYSQLVRGNPIEAG